MLPGITHAGERAHMCTPPAHTNTSTSTGRATASQGRHWIIPPGMCHLSIMQDTSLTWHHLKDTAHILDLSKS